ncbi:hypothetical protein LTR35_018014 [Friedmanniomyces endolithicus]|nr:hypothetical protein LTS09_018122 [Friedmanniomyces endolithicus]KAK0260411.1 hypothetical protein LTR35_018014 [Friedmanniomyces endolithicus]KAK0267364.1 hypothetical protein LTS00_017816 [Friedmanniomyces endolithicus]KAK0969643.1 hypothetical protein LTR54_018073 [Friedmanniomyces endolithicus]
MTNRVAICDEPHEERQFEAANDGDTIFVLASKITIKVSSTLLSCTSPVLAAMLNGSFAEGQLSKTVDNPADDDESLVLLCNLLHFRHAEAKILQNLAPTTLAEKTVRLATIADRYDRVDACGFIGEALLSRCAKFAEDVLPFGSAANLAAAAYLLQQAWYFAVFNRRLVLRYSEPFSEVNDHPYGNSLLPLTLHTAGEKLIDRDNSRGRGKPSPLRQHLGDDR